MSQWLRLLSYDQHERKNRRESKSVFDLLFLHGRDTINTNVLKTGPEIEPVRLLVQGSTG
jgi:hypothetical protein